MRILIVGGGTGGHLFPAIALAEAFMIKDQENQIQFVVTPRALDSQVLEGRGYPFQILKMEGIKGKGLTGKIAALSQLPQAFGHSFTILKGFKPELVLGVGGYVSGPLVLSAWLKGIPCAIQEQNSVPGMTNRLLGMVVDRVFTAFKESESYFGKRKVRITGNPIRRELHQVRERKVPASGPLTVLILGGSQGAHRINQTVMDALDEMVLYQKDLHFIHQTGEKDQAPVARAYREKGFSHQVQAFIPDMVRAYEKADAIIGRAGAMTLAEITALGKPGLLIPFPFAANHHQEHNALALVKAGAAEMILEKDLRADFLADRIRDWLGNREQLTHMAHKAKTIGRLQAAEEIVECCYELIQPEKRVLN